MSLIALTLTAFILCFFLSLSIFLWLSLSLTQSLSLFLALSLSLHFPLPFWDCLLSLSWFFPFCQSCKKQFLWQPKQIRLRLGQKTKKLKQKRDKKSGETVFVKEKALSQTFCPLNTTTKNNSNIFINIFFEKKLKLRSKTPYVFNVEF